MCRKSIYRAIAGAYTFSAGYATAQLVLTGSKPVPSGFFWYAHISMRQPAQKRHIRYLLQFRFAELNNTFVWNYLVLSVCCAKKLILVDFRFSPRP